MKTVLLSVCMLLSALPVVCCAAEAPQEQERLFERILRDTRATVGVAVMAGDTLVARHNARIRFPLMSVFKFHVALAVLDKMDKQRTPLDSLVEIKAARMHSDTYSPLRKRFPDLDLSISLGELLQYSVSLSDNNACDVLIDYVGGIERVDGYIRSLGLDGFRLEADEARMHRDATAQYLNWSTPEAVVRLLGIACTQPLFAAEYREFLWRIMQQTETGADKLKGLLPPGVVVGHKTGSSDRTPEGVKIADNDAGFVVLDDRRTYFIAVFVMESQHSDRENAAIIARISRAVYDMLHDRGPAGD